MLARRVEDPGPRARGGPRSPLCPRSPGPRNSDAVPGRGHAVPVGLHMPPRDHVETLPGQRQQRRTVLGEQATFLRVLAAVRFRGQPQAPVRQPGAEVLQAPHARPGHEQLAPHHADLGLHRALLMTGIRVAERTIEPVMRLEGLEQARQARLAPPYPLWPTPAALSNTIRSGTPPSHSNRLRNARHVHSAFSPGINCTRPTFEYGKSSTK